MTSSRVYGSALDVADAVAECKRERGTQFAPEAVDALDRLWALGALDAADVARGYGRLAETPKRRRSATRPASTSARGRPPGHHGRDEDAAAEATMPLSCRASGSQPALCMTIARPPRKRSSLPRSATCASSHSR